jgi:hypothetical protein
MPPRAERTSHWDLMLEADSVLRTWALEIEPDKIDEQPALRLADHRLAYLQYEGEISGGRGAVIRWDSGNYETAEESDGRMLVDVRGQRLAGRIELTRAEDTQLWRLRVVRTINRGASDLSR